MKKLIVILILTVFSGFLFGMGGVIDQAEKELVTIERSKAEVETALAQINSMVPQIETQLGTVHEFTEQINGLKGPIGHATNILSGKFGFGWGPLKVFQPVYKEVLEVAITTASFGAAKNIPKLLEEFKGLIETFGHLLKEVKSALEKPLATLKTGEIQTGFRNSIVELEKSHNELERVVNFLKRLAAAGQPG